MRVLYVGMTRAKEKLIMTATVAAAERTLSALTALTSMVPRGTDRLRPAQQGQQDPLGHGLGPRRHLRRQPVRPPGDHAGCGS